MNTQKTKINLENKSNYQISEKIFYDVLQVIEKEEKKLGEKEVNILLCKDEEMLEYNSKYRGKYGITDVLSFPFEMPNLPILGDIIIDIQAANKQKGKEELTVELKRLFLHGILHLLGYDHLSRRQKEIMESKENKYWNKIREGDK